MIPTQLKRRLVEDWKLVSEQQHLVSLPSPYPVFSIFSVFLQQLPTTSRREEYVKVIDGLTAYFDKSLGSLLLYRFEKLQYSETIERSSGQLLSAIYGPEFLLRFFVKLPSLLTVTSIDDSTLQIIYVIVDEFLEWLNFNSAKYFSRKHYEPASPQYLRTFARF